VTEPSDWWLGRHGTVSEDVAKYPLVRTQSRYRTRVSNEQRLHIQMNNSNEVVCTSEELRGLVTLKNDNDYEWLSSNSTGPKCAQGNLVD
jgi:hypothetical protein